MMKSFKQFVKDKKLTPAEVLEEYYKAQLVFCDTHPEPNNAFFPKNLVPPDIRQLSMSPLCPLCQLDLNFAGPVNFLDLGCGPGADCFLASKLLDGRSRILGVDPNPHLIRRALEMKQRYNFENVLFESGAVEGFFSEAGWADLIQMNYAFHLVKNKPGQLKRILEALKPGGLFIAADNFKPQDINENDDPEEFYYQAASAVSPSLFEEMAEKAGFSEVTFIRVEDEKIDENLLMGFMVCLK